MTNRSRKGSRGNAQRSAGPRLSNAPVFSGDARPANSESPPLGSSFPPVESSIPPAVSSSKPPVTGPMKPTGKSPAKLSGTAAMDPAPDLRTILSNESVAPKAGVIEVFDPSLLRANDDEPPPSSTRTRLAEIAKEEVKVENQPSKEEPVRNAAPRAEKPKRAERRSRDRGRGARSSAAPSASARGSAAPASVRGAASSAPVSSAPPSPVRRPSDAPTASGSSGPPSADLAERFFEEGVKSESDMLATHDKPRPEAVLVHDDEEPTDLKILHKMQPEVRARRAKYVRYVTVVSAGCMLLGLAGLVKHKIARGDQEVAARDMAAYAAAHAPENSPVENAPSPSVPLPAQAAAAPAEPSAAASVVPPVATAVPDPAADGAAVPAASAANDKSDVKPDAPADTETPHAKTAAQEKRDCQVLLDRGAFGKAIEAGQRSVALDPSDGEAWLLLGAAYQSLGRVADARRSFSSCLKQGKKGPLGECKAMLQ